MKMKPTITVADNGNLQIPGGHPNSSTCGHLKFPHPPRPA